MVKSIYRYINIKKFEKKYKKESANYKLNFDFGSVANSKSKKCSIAIITMVKNESDIIEEFVRVNSKFSEHIFVIDDGSTDGTLEILDQLRTEGFSISYVTNKTVDYQQNFIMTSAVNEVANTNIFGFIMPLDADEFILNSSELFAEILKNEEKNTYVLRWSSIIPDFDLNCRENYINQHALQITNESKVCNKMLLRNDLAKNCYVHMGNHDVSSNVMEPSKAFINTKILHIPVRSAEQILSKILIGSYKFMLKKNKTRGEGSHWMSMAETVRNAKLRVDSDMLREFAYNYAGSQEIQFEENVSSLAGAGTGCEIRYSNRKKSSLLVSMDDFVLDIVNK
jgi:glycosyltransferase involved in cell wall biosynthesis